MLRWVSTAALATPVVPPVYCRNAMSSRPEGDRLELEAEACPERALERIAPGMLQGGTCLRTWRSTKFTIEASRESEQIADSGHQYVLEAGARQHLLQHVREVLDDDDGLRAGILQLMLEFARRCTADWC